MNIFKRTGYAVYFSLLLALLIGVTAQPVVNAAPGEEIKLNVKYPSLSAPIGSNYDFEIDLTYTGGDKPKIFNLRAIVPGGFNYQISRSYGGGSTNISAIQLDPDKSSPETIKVSVQPSQGLLPLPGDYKISVEAASGAVKNTIEVNAVVTPNYTLRLETSQDLVNTRISAGKDNYFSYKVQNAGASKLDNIKFSQSIRGGHSDWIVTFTPDTIDTLPLGAERDIQINIKPSDKTSNGDYEVTLTAATDGNTAFDKQTIRVTVVTSTVWGWIIVFIVIVAVVGGLVALFFYMSPARG